MEIRPVTLQLFLPYRWSEEQADMTQLIVAFRNFANTTKIGFMFVVAGGNKRNYQLQLLTKIKYE